MHLEQAICPLCYNLYPETLAHKKYPFCPDCGSEAIDVEVVPLRRYLAETSTASLIQWRDSWAAITGFRENYKAAKLERIERAMLLKAEYQAERGAAQ
jgi:hypothetical protein